MLVGMGAGITATVGFHISVKEPSEEDRVEGFKLSSMEVKIYISFVKIHIFLRIFRRASLQSLR